MLAHDSFDGDGRPSMRHTKASPYCCVPVTVKPAAVMASSPVDGDPGAQPLSICPPNGVKSTTTVTPDVGVQDDEGAAVPGSAGRTTPGATNPTPVPTASAASRRNRVPVRCRLRNGEAPTLRPVARSTRRADARFGYEQDMVGMLSDAVVAATGRARPAAAGIACTVANTLGSELPG